MADELEFSVPCAAPRATAWRVWSDVRNWAAVDPSVESAEIDGPFASGTRGRTVSRGGEPVEWLLAEVDPGVRAVVEIAVPGAVAHFEMSFADDGAGGSLITQRVWVTGERAAEVRAQELEALARELPDGMRRLAEFVARSAG